MRKGRMMRMATSRRGRRPSRRPSRRRAARPPMPRTAAASAASRSASPRPLPPARWITARRWCGCWISASGGLARAMLGFARRNPQNPTRSTTMCLSVPPLQRHFDRIVQAQARLGSGRVESTTFQSRETQRAASCQRPRVFDRIQARDPCEE